MQSNWIDCFIQNKFYHWKSNLMNASSMNKQTLLEIIAPDASISVQNAAKLLAAGAPPQIPLRELTYTIFF